MSALSPTSAPAFLHNLDTCVGCHACVIACANENGLTPGRYWRQIVTFNSSHVPELPVYHLSLACNHCLDAPCVPACPAAAIGRDHQTGVVLIENSKCIGCRYCSWVCPFDAPQFNSDAGVMEKCTFCNHRLLQHLKPGCTSLCPTGALSFGMYGDDDGVGVQGFPESQVRPAIAFLPMRGRSPQPAPPEASLPDEPQIASWIAHDGLGMPDSKISLKTEWPLAVFSFIAIALVAWFLADLWGASLVGPEIFAVLGVAGIGLSTMHLGRKERARRAILDWRTSWLSREVILYPLFILMGMASVAGFPGYEPLAWVAAAMGVMLLVTIDNVYSVMARDWFARLDGQASLLSAAFLISVIAGNPLMAGVTGMLRLYAVLDRMSERKKSRLTRKQTSWLSLFHLLIGLILPALFWVIGGGVSPKILVCALLGEFVDRLDFYYSLDITTPRRSMAAALRQRLV